MYNRSLLTILIIISWCCLFTPIGAQTYLNIKEINPTRSTWDANDPNSSSGGRVNGMAVSADGNTFYAASEWGGLWKSIDKGLNWNQLTRHIPQATWDVKVNPTNANQVFATSLYDGRI